MEAPRSGRRGRPPGDPKRPPIPPHLEGQQTEWCSSGKHWVLRRYYNTGAHRCDQCNHLHNQSRNRRRQQAQQQAQREPAPSPSQGAPQAQQPLPQLGGGLAGLMGAAQGPALRPSPRNSQDNSPQQPRIVLGTPLPKSSQSQEVQQSPQQDASQPGPSQYRINDSPQTVATRVELQEALRRHRAAARAGEAHSPDPTFDSLYQ